MIRFATARDLPAMLEIYRPYVEQTTYSFEYETPSLEEFARRFADHTTQFPWLVWEEEGRVLGYAYAGAPWERAAYRWCGEVTVYLHESIHGKGVGKALYKRLEEILQKQGYRLVYALVTTENAPSLAFHKAVGYRQRAVFPNCGFKMGRWLGVVWLEKQLNPPGLPTQFPAAYTQTEDA